MIIESFDNIFPFPYLRKLENIHPIVSLLFSIYFKSFPISLVRLYID